MMGGGGRGGSAATEGAPQEAGYCEVKIRFHGSMLPWDDPGNQFSELPDKRNPKKKIHRSVVLGIVAELDVDSRRESRPQIGCNFVVSGTGDVDVVVHHRQAVVLRHGTSSHPGVSEAEAGHEAKTVQNIQEAQCVLLLLGTDNSR